ncbi:MAG: hypothetical protein AAB900_00190 [Patescibacteria group bacterium]
MKRDRRLSLIIYHLLSKSVLGWHLPDGIHRCFLAGSVGTTIEAIVIKGVTAPPRAKLLQWSDLRCVDEKPPMAERSVNNNPDLYRLWENVGIDG